MDIISKIIKFIINIMKTSNPNQFQKKLRDGVEKLCISVFKEKWRMYYDLEMDVLHLTAPKLSEKFVLFPVNEKNMSIRVNYKGKLEGVVIDNFQSFFVAENPEFFDFAEGIAKIALPNYIEVKKDNKLSNNKLSNNNVRALIYEFCKMMFLQPEPSIC